jgi:hypothetical protein
MVRTRASCALATLAALSVLENTQARGGAFCFESSGVRGGFGLSGSDANFRQAEAFVDWDLPWGWNLGRNWHVQTRLDFSAGWLGETGADGYDSAILTVGPIFALTHGHFPIFLEAGLSPTGITRSDFNSKGFGEDVQFTSHIGIGYDIASHLRISYRYQHMSNGGLSTDNPGLNLHMFGLSYIF